MHDTKLPRRFMTVSELFRSIGGLAEAKRRVRLLRERMGRLSVAQMKATRQG